MKDIKDIKNHSNADHIETDFEKKQKIKLWILDLSISFAVLATIAALVAVIVIFYNVQWDYENYPITCWVDILTVPGVLGLFFWLLVWVTNEGAFDLIVYSTRKFLSFVFRFHPEDSKLPRTYADYVEMKHSGKKPNRHWGILIIGALFLVVGLILMIPSNIIEGGVHNSDPAAVSASMYLNFNIIGGF